MGPNCKTCRHYFITYDPRSPNGCRRFNLKSRELPSVIVKMAGQGECHGHEEKPNKEKKSDSLADPRYG
jgi:hypothetical protein